MRKANKRVTHSEWQASPRQSAREGSLLKKDKGEVFSSEAGSLLPEHGVIGHGRRVLGIELGLAWKIIFSMHSCEECSCWAAVRKELVGQRPVYRRKERCLKHTVGLQCVPHPKISTPRRIRSCSHQAT